MKIDFDPAAHAYRLDGRPVPSVTQVLGLLEDWSAVRPDVLEAAARFGTHVHEAVHLDCRGELDEAALDPAIAPYLAGWRAFLSESGATVIASEVRVAHQTLQYAGTADVIVEWRNVLCLMDIKSGQVPRTWRAQTAAYARAWDNQRRGDRPISSARYCVQLRDDGSYKTHKSSDPSDWTLFLSALNVWKFINAST